MSDNECCFPWPRYWCQDGSNDYGFFMRKGYLTLPSMKQCHFYSDVPKQLEDLVNIPVLILLGEPGYGKSQSLSDEYQRLREQQADDLLTFCDLKTYGPGDQESLKNELLDAEKLKLVEQGKRLWILLDGLDECGLYTPEDWLIRELVNKINYPQRVFIRLTCRASHRPQLLEKAFSQRWRSVHNSPIGIWRLCPLREEDIRIAARAKQINAEDFLSVIADRNVESLAALPVTLKFMLRLFREKKLPKQRTEIFELGLKLLSEDSPERRKSLNKYPISADVRFQAAARIALGYILQGCNGIWNGPHVECRDGLFNAKDITIKEIDSEITEQAVTETLELTGVFVPLDGQRFQFASRTFAEFLAAWFISKSKVSLQQKLKVLLHPESQRLIPDLHEMAAWLGALNPQFFAWLIKKEPEAALEADFVNLAQSELPALVHGLLVLAAKEQRSTYNQQQLSKLKHPGLETQLSRVITNRSKQYASRALAIRIANSCESKGLSDALASLALDEHEDFLLRKQSIYALESMDDDAKIRLVPVAELSSDLSLKAASLCVVGPRLMGAEALL